MKCIKEDIPVEHLGLCLPVTSLEVIYIITGSHLHLYQPLLHHLLRQQHSRKRHGVLSETGLALRGLSADKQKQWYRIKNNCCQ